MTVSLGLYSLFNNCSLAFMVYCSSKSLPLYWAMWSLKSAQLQSTYGTKIPLDFFVIILTLRYEYFASYLWLCDKLTEYLISKQK